MTTDALNRATNTITAADLQHMVLEVSELPADLSDYQIVRESVLDNETMAEQGFATASAERFRDAGRVTGYVREFGPNTMGTMNAIVGTVAHLFDNPQSVSGWMHDVFLKDFEDNVGADIDSGHELLSVDRLEPTGFYDEAVALKAIQNGPSGVLASTVVDFRVGCVLGVAYVGGIGDREYLELASQVGLALEKSIVSVALGTK